MKEPAMPKTLNEVIAALPQESRDKIEHRAQELVRQTSLRELRKALGLTQKQLAEALKVSQAAVSKQEYRKDVHISTLCDIVRAMGGHVEILAHFPGDRVVRL
jgi:DNA-binding transcriptional regulator YiaG